MKGRLAAAVLGTTIAVLGLILASLAAGPAAGTFDGAPSTPLNFAQGSFLAGWDVQIHSRDAQNHPGRMDAIVAEHGSDCGAPPAAHSTDGSAAGLVFQCSNHVMTALEDEGYGVIYLTPPQMVNFSGGGTLSFDLSTEDNGGRNWWDITVSPFEDTQALPLLSDLSQGVDLQGPNKNSIVITTDNGEGAPNLKVVRNGLVADYGGSDQPANAGIVAGTNEAATRQPFRLTLSPVHVRFERLASATGSAVVFVDQAIPALNWTSGVVQLGHHAYNPNKDGIGPETWHWDNIAISPAVQFSIGSFTSRYTQGGTINAASPAPAGAYLHFSAICSVKVNGVTAAKMVDGGHPEHFSSYMVPVAAGATSWSISFANDSWYTTGLGCLAKDYALWSAGGSANGPTSTPTSPPTATGTAPGGSPTVTPTASATPVQQITMKGTVSLEGIGPAGGVAVSAGPGGGSTTTLADGTFVLPGLPGNRTYTVTARSVGFVSAVRESLQVTTGSVVLPGVTLKAGDIDGNEAVNIVDVSVVAGAFGLAATPAGGDLNRTGVVDIADVSAVATNFGLTGPTAW